MDFAAFARKATSRLIFLSLAYPSSGQSVHARSGSIVTAFFSRNGDYFVIAGDSRETITDNGQKDDRGCKIISLGNSTIFFSTGNAEFYDDLNVKSVGKFNTYNDARSVYKSSPTSDAKDLASAWTRTPMQVYGAESPQMLRLLSDQYGTGGDNGLVTGCFVTYKSTILRPIGVCAEIRFTPNTSRMFPRYDEMTTAGGYVLLGMGKELTKEFFQFRSKRVMDALMACCNGRKFGVDAENDAKVVGASVQFAIDNSSAREKAEIHGPIDFGILTGAGMSWLRRKKNCYAEDVQDKNLPTKSLTLPRKTG